jgi:hypothetical protein
MQGRLKIFYRDLEYFRPFKAHDPRDVPLLREWFEPILVQAFLEGMNPEFNFRAQLILSSSDWPTLDQTIASVLEEETRLANQDVVASVYGENRAALMHIQSSVVAANYQPNAIKFDPKKKTRTICENCKRPGHIKRNCFDLVGYPPGWQQKHVNRFIPGNSGEKKQDQVHLVTSSNDLPQAAVQALEEFKAKLMAATADGPSEASSSHDGKGEDGSPTPWIIDSGATNHMTGSPQNFSSYTPRSGRDRVSIANGSFAPIVRCGTVNCTPSLSLSPVLHVPKFPVSLLSISSITKHLYCRAIFEP